MKRYRIIRAELDGFFFYYRIDSRIHKTKKTAISKATSWTWECPLGCALLDVRKIAKRAVKRIAGVTLIDVCRSWIAEFENKTLEDKTEVCGYEEDYNRMPVLRWT